MTNPTDDDSIRHFGAIVASYPVLRMMLDALCEIDAEYDREPVDLILDKWHEALEEMIRSLKPPPETPVLCSIVAEAAE